MGSRFNPCHGSEEIIPKVLNHKTGVRKNYIDVTYVTYVTLIKIKIHRYTHFYFIYIIYNNIYIYYYI